jgi:hypothetical protein
MGIMDWSVNDRWVYQEGNWYLQPNYAVLPIGANIKSAQEEKAEAQKRELRKSLQFEQSVLDFGMVKQGDPVSFSLKYSLNSDVPLPVTVERSTEELSIKGLDNGRLLPGTLNKLTISLSTRQYDGVVVERIVLTALREDVSVKFEVPVQGFVYTPVSVVPRALRFDAKDRDSEKTILVRNNSKSTVKLTSISNKTGTIAVESLPATVPAGQTIQLRIKQVRNVEKSNVSERISIALAQPIEGISSVSLDILLNADEKKSELGYDPSQDPTIQEIIKQNRMQVPTR